MQLKYESIEILLPWEPFCKTGDSYFDEKSGALVIPFSYCGKERGRCPNCGEEFRVHSYRNNPPCGTASRAA